MPKPRKQSSRKPERTLKVFCEGEKTEPLYINGYLQTLPDQNGKSVVTVEKTRKNTAVQLVEAAIQAKKSRSSLPDDQFWVVYDREAISKYADSLHAKARDKADRAGMGVL